MIERSINANNSIHHQSRHSQPFWTYLRSNLQAKKKKILNNRRILFIFFEKNRKKNPRW